MASQLQRVFDGETYDVFIGRVYSDGPADYVTLDFEHPGGFHGYRMGNLEQACHDLARAVKAGKKVLLTNSPGELGERRGNAEETYRALSDAIEVASKELGRPKPLVLDRGGPETYILKGVKFEHFLPFEMERLRSMFERMEDMRGFPDPFQYQPR